MLRQCGLLNSIHVCIKIFSAFLRKFVASKLYWAYFDAKFSLGQVKNLDGIFVALIYL
jgi:hypothetical protein